MTNKRTDNDKSKSKYGDPGFGQNDNVKKTVQGQKGNCKTEMRAFVEDNAKGELRGDFAVGWAGLTLCVEGSYSD